MKEQNESSKIIWGSKSDTSMDQLSRRIKQLETVSKKKDGVQLSRVASAPPPPQITSATSANGSFRFAFRAIDNPLVAGYNIYRSNQSANPDIAEFVQSIPQASDPAIATMKFDSSTDGSGLLVYWVCSYNARGVESKRVMVRVTILPSSISIPSVKDYGAVGDGRDDSDAIQLAANAGVGYFPGPGVYRITKKINWAGAGIHHIYGDGAVYNDTILPTLATVKGTLLVWDGTATDQMFDIGGGPIYVDGVLQSSYDWQNNTTVEDLSINCNKGAKSLIYAHSIDNFTLRRVFVNGGGREDVRGTFDIRGTMSQPIIEGVTVYNVPKGYGIRLGDGACWCRLQNCAIQKTALSYWIGDTPTYERPWAVRGISLNTCSVEGSVVNTDMPEVKFSISSVSGNHSSGVTAMNVADGTKFAVDDAVFIGREDDNFEMNTVESINGNALTLVYATDYAHATGQRIVAGTIGVHIGGRAGLSTIEISFKHPMFNWVGCGIDAHHIDGMKIDTPDWPSKFKRGIYLDGDWLQVELMDPYTCAFPQDSDCKFLEITDHVSPGWFFTWRGRLDRSGVASPYQIDQTEFDGVYVGNDAIEGLNSLPPKFRFFQADYTGITLRETTVGAGLKYAIGAPGTAVSMMKVGPSGTFIIGSQDNVDPADDVINFSVDSDGSVYHRKQIVLLSNCSAADASNNSIYVDSTNGTLYFKNWEGNSFSFQNLAVLPSLNGGTGIANAPTNGNFLVGNGTGYITTTQANARTALYVYSKSEADAAFANWAAITDLWTSLNAAWVMLYNHAHALSLNTDNGGSPAHTHPISGQTGNPV
jgi:hypothetical protein